MRLNSRMVVVACFLILAGCGADEEAGAGLGTDAAADAASDVHGATPDVGADTGTDTGTDTEDDALAGPDTSPPLPDTGSFCGDGTLDPGEECDDGNRTDGDGCASDCTNEGPCAPEPLDPTGTYFAVLTTTLDRNFPVIAAITIEANATGYDAWLYPLEADTMIDDEFITVPNPQARQLVGDAVRASSVDLGGDRNLTITFDDVQIPGEANAINGRPFRGDFELVGAFVLGPTASDPAISSDAACGDLDGNLVEPLALRLSGSTFSMTRMDGASPLDVQTVPRSCEEVRVPPVGCDDGVVSERCSDEVDNDGDGAADCADPDCAADLFCP